MNANSFDMKKNVIFILLFFGTLLTTFSQGNSSNGSSLDDFGRIGFFIDAIISDPDFKGRPLDKVKGVLERMLLKESMGKSIDERFGLVARPIIYSKEKTSTTPAKYFYEFGIDIIAIDYIEKTKYGVYTFEGLRGMDANSERALMSGLKEFKSSKGFSDFIREVKQKITDFYESNCDFIITDAETNASNDNFDNSLTILAGVPTVCKSCYDRAQEKSTEIYIKKLERECQALVAEAGSLIAAEEWESAAGVLKKVLPGISCHSEAVALIEKIETHWCGVNLGKAKGFQQTKNFDEAARYLSLVPTTSPCAQDADALGKKIYGELTAIEQRDWDFKMKQYDDNLRIEQRNFDFSVNKFERSADREDRELDLTDKRLNKEIDNSLEKTKIIQTAIVEKAKADAKAKKIIVTSKDYKFLEF
jgi:hypothetical protein